MEGSGRLRERDRNGRVNEFRQIGLPCDRFGVFQCVESGYLICMSSRDGQSGEGEVSEVYGVPETEAIKMMSSTMAFVKSCNHGLQVSI